MKRTLLTLATLVFFVGCAKPATTTAAAAPMIPCAQELGSIASATDGDQADARIAIYLDCAAELSRPPNHIGLAVQEELRSNPYPGVRRDRDEVWARYFDLEQLKQLPTTLAGTKDYVDTLEAQARAHEAMGDKKLAAAARARAVKVRQIIPVLEDIQDGA